MTTDFAPAVRQSTTPSEQESSRAITEAQAAMIVAQRFQRDVDECLIRIKKACGRRMLAEKAMYAYPRGKQMVEGPSIRLAECIAQNWKHLNYGIREISQKDGVSEVEAYCWDMEMNVRRTIQFTVPHIRKADGQIKRLTDPRDIYEMVANQGARRLRACIIGVIPVDIIEEAVDECNKTLSGKGNEPIEDRVRKMLSAFDKLGVTKEMIETRLGHKTAAIVEAEIIALQKVYNSIKDGMSHREDWFKVGDAATTESTKELTEKIKGGKGKKTEPAAPACDNTLCDANNDGGCINGFVRDDEACKEYIGGETNG